MAGLMDVCQYPLWIGTPCISWSKALLAAFVVFTTIAIVAGGERNEQMHTVREGNKD